MNKYKISDKPPLGGWASGNYCCVCVDCGDGYLGDKRSMVCADCAHKQKDPLWKPVSIIILVSIVIGYISALLVNSLIKTFGA